MNPDLILHANVLDIIFENRNKEYGAYELRTRYTRRFKKAMLIMFSTVIIFCLILFVDAHFFHHQLSKIITYEFPDVKISEANEPNQPIKTKPAQPVRQQQIATIRDVTPRIVRNNIPADNLPTVEELQLKEIGPETKPGEIAGSAIPVSSTGNEKGNPTEKTNEEPTIFDRAEFMPEYPGGEKALVKFLKINLKYPTENLEPGSQIKVIAKFVVDKNGKVTEIEIQKSGGKDFDDEVMRTMKKMQTSVTWIPGKQNGRNVAVYFYLPVVFQSQDDN